MEEATQIWSAKYGNAGAVAAQILELAFPQMLGENRDKTLYLLDHEGTGTVTKENFVQVVSKFGHPDNLVRAVGDLFDMPAFFGFISSEWASLLLKSESNEEGMYVIRLSALNSPTAISIDYIQYGNLKTIDLVYHPREQTWEPVGTGNNYSSVSAAIQGIGPTALRRAYYRQFAKLPFFYWDATSQKVNQLLANAAPSQFILRFSSSTHNAISVGAIGKDRKVTQSLIQLLPQGRYHCGKEYDTLEAMLDSSFFKKLTPLVQKTRALARNMMQVAPSAQAKPATTGYEVCITDATNTAPEASGGIQRASSTRGVLNTLPSRPTGSAPQTGPSFKTDAAAGRQAASMSDLREAMDRYSISDAPSRGPSRKLEASTDGFPSQADDSDAFPVVASPRGDSADDAFPVVSDGFPLVSNIGTTTAPSLVRTVSSPLAPQPQAKLAAPQPGPSISRAATVGVLRGASPSPPPQAAQNPAGTGGLGALHGGNLYASEDAASFVFQGSAGAGRVITTNTPARPAMGTSTATTRTNVVTTARVDSNDGGFPSMDDGFPSMESQPASCTSELDMTLQALTDVEIEQLSKLHGLVPPTMGRLRTFLQLAFTAAKSKKN